MPRQLLDCGDGVCEVTALDSAASKTSTPLADRHCPHPKRRLRWRSVAAVQDLPDHRGLHEQPNRNKKCPEISHDVKQARRK